VSFTLQIGRSGEIPFTPSAPVPEGASFVFTVKKTVNSAAAVISATDITFDFENQKGVIHLRDADTAPLTPGSWLCDVQAIVSPDQNYVLAESSFTAKLPVRGD